MPKIHSIPLFFTGSFAVDNGDHLGSRIIYGPFWGSFPVGYHLRYCTFPSSEKSHFQNEAKSKTILVKMSCSNYYADAFSSIPSLEDVLTDG